MMTIACCGRTDKGRLRPHNEDALLVDPAAGLFAVADGMGGHAAGEVASRLAIEAVSAVLGESRGEGADVRQLVHKAIDEANERIAEQIRQRPECAGMGTTLVLTVLDGQRCWIAHVGDSRAYRVRRDGIEQLTSDHSFVNELVRLGMLSREQAARDPRRNVVTRALGSTNAVAPDVTEIRGTEGDLILLCSDGLNSMLGDEEILSVVRGCGDDLESVCDRLVEAANRAGGEDNITVVLLRPPVAERTEQPTQPVSPPQGTAEEE